MMQTQQKMTLRPKVEIPSDFYETVGAEAMEDYLSFMVVILTYITY